jgi:hypothetical protein
MRLRRIKEGAACGNQSGNNGGTCGGFELQRNARVGDLEEQSGRDAAPLLDFLRRVAREMAFEHLEDASRMLERLVAIGTTEIRRLAAAVLSVPAVLVRVSRLMPARSGFGGIVRRHARLPHTDDISIGDDAMVVPEGAADALEH